MKKEYKITLRSFLKEWGINILLMLFVLYLLYISHKPDPYLPNRVNDIKLIPIMFTIYMLVAGFAPMFVLLNHYNCDKNTVLIIDTDSGEFIYKRGSYSKTEKIKDIHLVKIYYCPASWAGGFSKHYFEIHLSDETQITVSSLVESSWLEYLDNARIVEEPRFFILV